MKWLVGLLALVVACSAQPLWAQQYKTHAITAPEIDPDSNDPAVRIQYNQALNEVKSLLRDKSLNDAGRQKMRRFFRDAYLKSWTSPKNWATVGDKRREFFRNFYGPFNTNPDGRKLVNEIMLEFMREYVKPEYHPVLRYNAVLILGDLRAKESAIGSQDAAEPYPEATPILLSLIEDPKQSDAIKVGAWVGMLNRSRLYGPNLGNMPDAEKKRVITQVTTMLSSDTPPEGMSQVAFDWIQKRAVDVAAAMGNSGENGSIAKALDKIIANEEADMSLRSMAMAARGELKYDEAASTEIDALKQATIVGKIAVATVGEDLKNFQTKLENYQKLFPTSSYGYEEESYPEPTPPPKSSSRRRSRGESSDPYDDPYGEEYEEAAAPKRSPQITRIESLFRRRAKMHLDQAKTALVGISPVSPNNPGGIDEGVIRFASDPEDKTLIARLAQSMNIMLAELDKEDSQETVLLENSQKSFRGITRLAQTLAEQTSVSASEAVGPAAPADGPPADGPPGADGPPAAADGPPGADGPPPRPVPPAAAPADGPPASAPPADGPMAVGPPTG